MKHILCVCISLQAEIWEEFYTFSYLSQSQRKKLPVSYVVVLYYYFNKSYKWFFCVFFDLDCLWLWCMEICLRESISEVMGSFHQHLLKSWIASTSSFISGLVMRDFCDGDSQSSANVLIQMGGGLALLIRRQLRKWSKNSSPAHPGLKWQQNTIKATCALRTVSFCGFIGMNLEG